MQVPPEIPGSLQSNSDLKSSLFQSPKEPKIRSSDVELQLKGAAWFPIGWHTKTCVAVQQFSCGL